jgi:hypothetical protein
MSETSPPIPNASAAFYAVLYPALRDIAKIHGYALAIHGTMTRDFDLVAIPWIDEASEPLKLILAMKEATATVTHTSLGDEFFPDCQPYKKPHGRVCYSLHFTDQGCDGPYLDVSVMPKSFSPVES